MCTVVLLIRPDHAVPVLIAANRDERLDRPWDPPGAHWPGLPGVTAGRDGSAGGTWMGVNRAGVAAAVLNRQGTLGPAAGKRSRGELPLAALAEGTAEAATVAITGLDAGQWRSFNMVIADRAGALFVRGLGHGRPEATRLGPGVHMVTAHDPDDLASPRVARHLPRFRAAPPPGAAAGLARVSGWGGWPALLADRDGTAAEQINVAPRDGFGTSSSALLAVRRDLPPIWLFAPGPPDQAAFACVDLQAAREGRLRAAPERHFS